MILEEEEEVSYSVGTITVENRELEGERKDLWAIAKLLDEIRRMNNILTGEVEKRRSTSMDKCIQGRTVFPDLLETDRKHGHDFVTKIRSGGVRELCSYNYLGRRQETRKHDQKMN